MSVKFIANGNGEPADVIIEASEDTWKKFAAVLRAAGIIDMTSVKHDEALIELLFDIREAGND